MELEVEGLVEAEPGRGRSRIRAVATCDGVARRAVADARIRTLVISGFGSLTTWRSAGWTLPVFGLKLTMHKPNNQA